MVQNYTVRKIEIAALKMEENRGSSSLKVVSATFLLVCFFRPKESTCETWNNVFLFHFKSSFRSRKSNFRILDIQVYDVIKCLSIKQETHFC